MKISMCYPLCLLAKKVGFSRILSLPFCSFCSSLLRHERRGARGRGVRVDEQFHNILLQIPVSCIARDVLRSNGTCGSAPRAQAQLNGSKTEATSRFVLYGARGRMVGLVVGGR